LQLLRTIANQAGLALTNARLFRRTEEALAEQRTLFDITQAATASPDPGVRLQNVATALSDTFAGADIAILMVDSEGGRLTQVAGSARISAPDQTVSLQSGILREAVLRSRPVLVADLRRLAGYDSERDALSQLVVPISFGRRTVGLINLESATTDAFSESDLRLVQTLGPSIAATIESDRLFREIQEANEQLRELDRLKMQFLASMSHELRTPLNSIIGFSRVILKGIDGPINEQQGDDLTAIYNSGQHLLNIINDILDVARIEAGKLTLVYEQVDLVRLAERAIETVRGLVRAEEISLVADLAPDLPHIEADPVRLRQILLNLLSNAVKFTSAGEVRLRIEPRIPAGSPAPSAHKVAIIVTDTGPGIAEEEFQQIFTAFERTDRSTIHADEGTGLGLPITKRLVELHQGSVRLDSILGVGSTFTVLLPVVRPLELTPEPAPLPAVAAETRHADHHEESAG
jgi:signal transduction histidine kinase